MPNPNYLRGRQAEWAVRRDLERLGYCVTRAAASQGIFDIVGIGPTDVVAVQVKRGQRPPPRSAWEAVAMLPAAPSVVKVVLYYPDGAAATQGTAARVLYCSHTPLPSWFGLVRWLDGLPPKQQKFRGF